MQGPNTQNTQIIDKMCMEKLFVTCEVTESLVFYIHNIKSIFPQYNEMRFVLEESSPSPLMFHGFDGSRVEKIKNTWYLISAEGEKLLSRQDFGFPLGHKKWSKCDGSEVELLFNACNDHEFGCGDGSCVSMYKRCDQQIDCTGIYQKYKIKINGN